MLCCITFLFLKWIMLLPHRTLTTVAQCYCSVGESTLASVCSWCFGCKGTKIYWKNKAKMIFICIRWWNAFLDEEKRQVRGAIYTNLIKYMPIVSVGFIRIHTRLYDHLVPVFLRTIWKCSINVPSKLEGVGIENPCKCLTYRDFRRRVPGRTRTVDIQNHNLTL